MTFLEGFEKWMVEFGKPLLTAEAKPEAAAPVTECACRKALEKCAESAYHVCGDGDFEMRCLGCLAHAAEVKDIVHREGCSITIARAALATPCECAGLREKLARWKQEEEYWREDEAKLRAELAAIVARFDAQGECSGPLPGRNVTVVQDGEKTKFITQPEPPAPVTECACRKALELALSMIDQNYPVAAAVDDCRATLATPCSCTELREEAESDKWKQLDIAVSDNGRLRAELAAANERAERTEERAEKQHAVLTRAVDKHCAMRLHAERELAVARKDLREAVEALRKLTAESSGFLAQAEDDAREVFGNTNIAVLHHWIDNAAAIVARFDAQGGK